MESTLESDIHTNTAETNLASLIDHLTSKSIRICPATMISSGAASTFRLKSFDDFSWLCTHFGKSTVLCSRSTFDAEELLADFDDLPVEIEEHYSDYSEIVEYARDQGLLGIDLSDKFTRLTRYREYIGFDYEISLTMTHGNTLYTYAQHLDWISEFRLDKDQTIAAYFVEAKKAFDSHNRDRKRRDALIIERFDTLRHDPKFSYQITHKKMPLRAVITYLRDTIEGASELSDSILKKHATTLRDRILHME